MPSFVSSRRAPLSALVLLTLAGTPALAVDLTAMFVQTQTVPGYPAGTIRSMSSSLTGINNSRKVVTWLGFDDGSQFGATGVFTWQNGVRADVLRSNDVANAPGIASPVTGTQPAIIDDNGNVAFRGWYGPQQDDVNFIGPSRAGLQFVNRVGDANAPGNAQPWDPFVSVVANNNGHMAFYGRVGNNDLGLWLGTSSASTVRLAQEDVMNIPGTAQPISSLSFETPLVNSTGHALFSARYGPNDAEHAILFGSSDADLQVVARTHYTDVPGLPAGTKFDALYRRSLNNAGKTVVSGYWNNSQTGGLFTTARGLFEPVALEGITPAPGIPGFTFDSVQLGRSDISGNDQIVFMGSANNTTGLFRWIAGNISDVVLTGEAAPGTNSSFQSFDSQHVNAQGDIMFVATLADSRKGVWYVPAGGSEPIMQLLTGDLVDVFGDGSAILPIDQIAMNADTGGPQAGMNRLFNDFGDFVVRLDFLRTPTTPPLSGLYISTVVPTPGAMALLGLSGLAAARRRRR